MNYWGLGTRKQIDDANEYLEEYLAPMFASQSVKIPNDATYLACGPGKIRSLEPFFQRTSPDPMLMTMDLAITRQLGIEKTDHGKIFVHADTNLYEITVDNCVHSARGWFTTGDYVRVNVIPIDEALKAAAKKRLEDLKNKDPPEDMHPLTIECLLRLHKFIIDF